MWLIKPEFVTGYLQCLLAEIETTNIDIGHCETYYEINIRQQEFGPDSIWKRVQKNNGRPPQTIKDFLLCICVTPLKKQLESKD